MKHGALHDPDSPHLAEAIDYNDVRVRGVTQPVDWFQAWEWQVDPDGDMLGNDVLSDCCEVADLRLCQAWLAAQGLHWTIPLELVKIRYSQVGCYVESDGSTDNGTTTQTDMFAWQSAPIVANGVLFNVRWLTVPPAETLSALKRGPLLLTIGLTPSDGDDPTLWQRAPTSDVTEFHRVVAGAERGGLLQCHTYGRKYFVHPSRVVACDLLLHVDQPAALRSAGISWSAI